MMDNDIHLKLLANVPIEIEGIGQFQLPTVKEVIMMGESNHNKRLSLLLFSKDLVGENSEIEEYSDMEVFVTSFFYDLLFREEVVKSFKLFLNKELRITTEGVLYFDELREETILTEEKWEYIKKVTRIGNFIQEKKEDEYKAGNDKARQLIEKIMKRKKTEVKKEEKINLHSILSAVSCRTNGIDYYLTKTIYQLYDAFYRLRFVDNYNQITTGIYTGNVDQTKIKLADIDWANVINIK